MSQRRPQPLTGVDAARESRRAGAHGPVESRPRAGQTPNAGFRCLVKRRRDPSTPAQEGLRARSSCPPALAPGTVRGTPGAPAPRGPGARVRGACGARLSPSPRRGGGGEGADGSNYGSDPPPPVARGRKTGCERFAGREGRRPPRPASGRGRGADSGGDFLSLPGTWLGDSLRKGQAPPSRSRPLSACRPVSQQAQRLQVPRLLGFSGWASGPGWGEGSCTVVRVAT